MNTTIRNIALLLGFIGVFGNFTPVSAAYFNTDPLPRCPTQITETLSFGSEGSDVFVMQSLLSRMGLLDARPNGYFGPATKHAVKMFQRTNDIWATGIVGPTTRNAMNERICDVDPNGNAMSFSYDGYYASGVTYVDPHDPFVKVISPTPSAPVIYTNPGTSVSNLNGYATQGNGVFSSPNVTTPSVTSPSLSNVATTPVQAAQTNIIYSPSVGYTYGVTPVSGSLSILSPSINSVYREGDTVSVSWVTNNLTANNYTILLENTQSGQSKIVATTGSNTASFVLTREVLDALCAGACNPSAQTSFRIAVTTPLQDITGTISTFRATVSPIAVLRPYADMSTVSITSSKTPVSSGETFRLYVNIPTGTTWNSMAYGQYSIAIHATCPSGVSVVIAGTSCGQDFVIPFGPTYFQSEIPATITNPTWYQQPVTFTLTVRDLSGTTIGSSMTTVVANASPIHW